ADPARLRRPGPAGRGARVERIDDHEARLRALERNRLPRPPLCGRGWAGCHWKRDKSIASPITSAPASEGCSESALKPFFQREGSAGSLTAVAKSSTASKAPPSRMN